MKTEPDEDLANQNRRILALENELEQHRKEESRLRRERDKWETELSAVMPPDFKDWWQNDKAEWPTVARLVIESLREREATAWEQLAALTAERDALREALRDVQVQGRFFANVRLWAATVGWKAKAAIDAAKGGAK